MAAEQMGTEPVRELRVEGLGWLVVGAVLLGVVAGAFFLGRWVERRSHPEEASGLSELGAAGGSAATAPDADAAEKVTYFDHLKGPEKAAEPSREVRPAAPPREADAGQSSEPASGGPFFVQVFATRDRQTAESMIEKLRGDGLRVQPFAEREGQVELLRVRVGGYATAEEARTVAQKLQTQGYPGAFVARIE